MYRRRRVAERGSPFSFDSFLDLVANVIGVILRLILVAWVGSRLYKGPTPPPPPAAPEVQVAAFVPPAEDAAPLRDLERLADDLARSRQAAAAVTQTVEATRQRREQADRQAADLRKQREEVEKRQPAVAAALAMQRQAGEEAAQAIARLQERRQATKAELEALQKSPRATKQLAYRLPLSATVQGEEVFFECRQGRVALIDVAALVDEIRDQLRDKGKLLKSQWSVEATTGPVGPFRLRYTLERERNLLEGGGAPNGQDSFRYGLSRWVVEPVRDARGESAEDALKAGSAFRKVIDGLDPRDVVVTLWVYPDSFALYRALRDHLHDRDVVVAGRPLPDGVPIASSRDGSASRGQ